MNKLQELNKKIENHRKESKKIEYEAKAFYKDKTNPFSERLEIFTKYGDEKTSLYNFKDFDLDAIFNYLYTEIALFERHETINVISIIEETWADILYDEDITYKIINNDYVYTICELQNERPEKEVFKMVKELQEKAIDEGVISFDFDW